MSYKIKLKKNIFFHATGIGGWANNQGPNSSSAVKITATPADDTPKAARSTAKGRRHCDKIAKKKAGASKLGAALTEILCL